MESSGDPDEVTFIERTDQRTYDGPSWLLSWDGNGYDGDTCWIEAPEPYWESLEDKR